MNFALPFNRTCKVCSKYFSAKYLKEHEKLHKIEAKATKAVNKLKSSPNSETAIRKLRPKRIAAIRALEALAVINYDDDMEDAEWHLKEDLDPGPGVEIPIDEETTGNIVVPVEKCLYNEWAEDF